MTMLWTLLALAAGGATPIVTFPGAQGLGARWSAAHHRDCEQLAWTKRGELQLRLWGYGEGVSFDTTVSVPVPRE